MRITPNTATNPGVKASRGSASLISRFLIEYITYKKAAAPNIALRNSISMLIEKILSYSIIVKNGIENRSVTKEIRNEKSNALSENNVFFSYTADAAENIAEINASQNQFIALS